VLAPRIRAAEAIHRAAAAMDIVAAFNAAEAALWFAFAVATVMLGRRVRGLTPRLRAWIACAFLAFGASDLIEVRTGAWWNPPGLLILKGACLLAIVIAGWQLGRNRRGHPGG
jgi:hypothetical protein